jgi:hypothetical protein
MHHDALGKRQYPRGLGKVKHVETIEQFPRCGVPMFSTYQAVYNIQHRVANTHCIVTVGPVAEIFFRSQNNF